MIVSITKIELTAYSKLLAFMQLNQQIIEQLKQSPCKKFKLISNWNLKVWYTMTLWENEQEMNDFYRHGVHVTAMKQASLFSSHIKSLRIHHHDLKPWKEMKALFDAPKPSAND